MSYDAQKVTYQEVTIFDRPALFTECRIDRATVPEGVYRYELRHGDEDWGEPRELARNLMVNFYGTVLTREPFQLPMCICSAVRQLKVITSFIFIAISGSHLKRPKKNSKRMTGLQ